MKAMKIDKILTVDLTFTTQRQINGEDFPNYFGLLRKNELYSKVVCFQQQVIFSRILTYIFKNVWPQLESREYIEYNSSAEIFLTFCFSFKTFKCTFSTMLSSIIILHFFYKFSVFVCTYCLSSFVHFLPPKGQ